MQLYYHDNKSIGGPSKVVGNIKSGLTLAGEKIEENSEILDPSKKVLFTQLHPKIINCDLSKVIIGPNICVLPIDTPLVLEQKYHKILTPCEWVYNKYRRWLPENKLEVWPVGIDIKLFRDTKEDKKDYDCLIYKKNRSDAELVFVMEMLTEFNQSFNIIQSHIFAHKGLEKAAGLFFSKKKCPLQAKGYTIKGANNKNGHDFVFITTAINSKVVI